MYYFYMPFQVWWAETAPNGDKGGLQGDYSKASQEELEVRYILNVHAVPTNQNIEMILF